MAAAIDTAEDRISKGPKADCKELVSAAVSEVTPHYDCQTGGSTTTAANSYTTLKVFTLKKHGIWWLWKGFHTLTDTYGAERCIDRWHVGEKYFGWEYMDDCFNPQIRRRWLDNPSAFPTLKPDFDIFGIPPRSRKQRGWYHIHRPSCTFCYTVVLPTTRGTIPTSDSGLLRFPAEIIHQIAQDRELARTQLALVCKHWAYLCLSKTWGAELLGRAHVMKLRSLVTVPGSYLRTSISAFQNWISVPLDSKDEPWLHLLPATRKMLPRCADKMDRVEINGPVGKGLSTMHSIHTYLPRQLPSSFSNTILHLMLHKIHFRRLGDLAHTLSELRNLEGFTGRELTWADSEPALMPLHWRAASEHSESHAFLSPTVRLTDCTHDLEVISLLTGARYSCIHLRTILESLAYNGPTIEVRIMLVPPQAEGPSTVTVLTYHIDIASCLQLRVIQIWHTNIPAPLHVRLNLRLNLKPDRIKYINWEACDKAVKDCAQAPNIIFGRYSRHSPDDDFADDKWEPLSEDNIHFLTSHLPLLHAAAKVSYARPIDGEWDLKTEKEKEQDRVMKALVEMTNAKKEEVVNHLMKMEREEEETTTKERLAELKEMIDEDQWEEWELMDILKTCEHQVCLDLWDLLS